MAISVKLFYFFYFITTHLLTQLNEELIYFDLIG